MGFSRAAHTRPKSQRLDWGRLFARLACVVFAVVGTLPLAAGVLARTAYVRQWAARETARVLEELLGVHATYQVEVGFWPLELALRDISIHASDGGTPAFQAHRVAITPRIFSLLAGRLDVGDIEVDQPRARIVLVDGNIANVKYRLPKGGKSKKLERAPFSSLAITDASALVNIDGIVVDVGPADVDVFADRGPTFDVALRVGRSSVLRHRKLKVKHPGDPEESVDEDRLCQADLRAHYSQEGILVRRLALAAMLDADGKAGTLPDCKDTETEDDPNRVALRVSQVRLVLSGSKPSVVDGHVVAGVPVRLAERFNAGHFNGWAAFAGDIHYEDGMKLPELRGNLRGDRVGLGLYRFAEHFEGEIQIAKQVISSPKLTVRYGKKGTAVLQGLQVEPFKDGIPLSLRKLEGAGLRFQDFMENADVTPNTIVQWDLDKTVVTDFKGTVDPLRLAGDLRAETSNFEVFDRAYHRKDRRHMIGVHSAAVRGRFGVRKEGLQFLNTHADFGKSHVLADVTVGFNNDLSLHVGEGSTIDLADASPLANVAMSGVATVKADMVGYAPKAELKGDLAIKDLYFGGFPLGDVTSARVSFKPLKLDVFDLKAVKGHSHFTVPSARLDFEADATLVADADVKSNDFDVRDFFHMWHFDTDPRFAEILGKGSVDARVHYAMGGKLDRCGSGYLRVDGELAMRDLDLYEEKYDSATAEFDFRWFDQEAGDLGMDLNVPSLTLAKGSGTILGNLSLTDGAVVRGHMVATKVPLSKIQSVGELGQRVDSYASGVAEVSGTLDELSADISGRLSPTRVGRSTLPSSEFSVHLVPEKHPVHSIGTTRCGRPKLAQFDPNEYAADASQGVFHVSGSAFGGQVALDDVKITRQRNKRVQGTVRLRKLDLGALAELSPLLALADRRVEGRLSAEVGVDRLEMQHPSAAQASVRIDELWFGRSGYRMELENIARVGLKGGRLDMPQLALTGVMPGGEKAAFDLHGTVSNLGGDSQADIELTLKPTELSGFAQLVPRAERLKGTLFGKVALSGPVSQLRQKGRFELRQGEVALRGAPLSMNDINLVFAIEPDQLTLVEGRAAVAGGTIQAQGSMPIHALKLGTARGTITARGVSLPLGEGLKMALDADLETSWKPDAGEANDARNLPRVVGDVRVTSFDYTRKVTMTADIASLAKRGKRTEFESYDPAEDSLTFDVKVHSVKPLSIQNDLIDAKLEIEEPGLELSGTNQRFGMRGQLAVVKGGTIKLRRNEFEVTHGQVRFDDPERIAAKVDVTAVTDYTRYDDSAAAASAPTSTASTGNNSGGRWRITMRAHGDAENLRIDLTSEPELSQDDIFLLLTLGVTRAELDQAQSASAGQSVALEALGRLTGADEAVTKNVTVIDEFRFGSAYSSRTGRTEPTVTIGKRLSQRIRAYVTSGLSESREIRSNVQWRLSPRVSVEGSYDNVNDISSSALGNLGTDVRWRLEFE